MNKKEFWQSLTDEQRDYVMTCTFIQQAINTFQAELEKQPEGGVIPFNYHRELNGKAYWCQG